MTMYRPGGLTRINANALAQIGLATNGIIGLVGEAEGGTPGSITTIDDPALAKSSFRSGPLADAIKIAFDPSNDPRIPGGAFRCLCIRTNPGTQAALTLYNRYATGVTTAGSTTTLIQMTGATFVASALVGGQLVINGETRAISANTVTSITVTAFSSAPGTGVAYEVMSPMMVLTSIDYGSHTNKITFEFEPGVSKGEVWTAAFESMQQVSQDLGGKAFLQVEYVGQSSTTIMASGTTTAGGASSITDSAAAFGTLTDLFVLVTGGGLTQPNLRKISTNTGTQINVSSAFSTTPTSGATYEARKGQILDGTATAGAASTITLPATRDIALNELTGMQIVITDGIGAGQRRIISSNTAGLSSVVTVSQAWTTTPDATSEFSIRYVTSATGSFIGSTGKATGFQTSVAVNGAVAATGLNITFAPGDTLEQLAETINANLSYVATIPSGVNKQTTMASSFDFDLGNTAVELRNDKSTITTQPNPTYSYTVPWPNSFKRELQVAVDDINSSGQLVSAAKATSAPISGSGRPGWTGGSAGTVGDIYKYLSGGTRGESLNSHFQSSFDLLLGVRCNFVVPLISYDLTDDGFGSTATFKSVAAQLSAHCKSANGIVKSERGGLLGMQGTQTELLSEAAQLNSTDIQLSGQTLQVLDVDSNLVTMPEWSMAVAAAGMRAGAPEVGEPLTHKYIKTYALAQDSSWDPLDRTDANQMIGGGILFAEYVKGKGTRFVRDITTHIQDDNLAYMEGSVRDCVRYIAYGLRTVLEDRYTGVKATPANASGIKQTAATWLDAANAENICVSSLNDKGVLVPGYENLRVTVSGDIATIKVQVYPAVGINFQLNDIYLQLPRQAA
jgi:hypothetical protein